MTVVDGVSIETVIVAQAGEDVNPATDLDGPSRESNSLSGRGRDDGCCRSGTDGRDLIRVHANDGVGSQFAGQSSTLLRSLHHDDRDSELLESDEHQEAHRPRADEEDAIVWPDGKSIDRMNATSQRLQEWCQTRCDPLEGDRVARRDGNPLGHSTVAIDADRPALLAAVLVSGQTVATDTAADVRVDADGRSVPEPTGDLVAGDEVGNRCARR
jgi:hypothetical protein